MRTQGWSVGSEQCLRHVSGRYATLANLFSTQFMNTDVSAKVVFGSHGEVDQTGTGDRPSAEEGVAPRPSTLDFAVRPQARKPPSGR